LTLNLDVPVERDLRAQQRAFDLYRVDYNEERPHEALGQKPPATAYARSQHSYPRPSMHVDVPAYCHRAATETDRFGGNGARSTFRTRSPSRASRSSRSTADAGR
jgi:hypothetical protein